MIRPPGITSVAFSHATDGDLRSDPIARQAAAAALGISPEWATVSQVHGDRVVEVSGPGEHGPADALFTRIPRLPLAVFTADCAGVVLVAEGAVGVAHAGWRGMAAGVVARLREAMEQAGEPPTMGAIGPAIGPCCFEVGEEVAARFPRHRARTGWGTTSVDLWGAAADQLQGIQVWRADACTRHDPAFHSHRRDATTHRMAALGWLP